MTPDELLRLYNKLGFRLLYWERKGLDPKDWKGPRDKGWNDPDRVYPIELYNPEIHNLGTFTGHEVAPGRFLADVDLDWAEGLVLAQKLLPQAGFGFGRKGKRISHAFYVTEVRLDYDKYNDLTDDGTEGNGQAFVELRGGNSSRMTMIAPSLHSPDTIIELVLNGELTFIEAEALRAAVMDYAIGCLLLRRLPGGLHHEGRMALAGFLLKYGIPPERVTKLLEAVCEAQIKLVRITDPPRDIGDCKLVVESTLSRMKNKDKRIAGAPKFAEFCGERGKDIVARIRKWLGGPVSENGLILNPQEPLRSATIFMEQRYTENGSPKLWTQNEVFYRFSPPAFREVEEAMVRGESWKFLDSAMRWSEGKDPTLVPYQPNSSKVSNFLDALRGVTGLSMDYLPPCWIANDPGYLPYDIIAFRNGLLHIPTRTLVPSTPDFFTVNGLPFDYDPDAKEPETWLRFLQDLWSDDPEAILTLQEVFGYLLTPDTRFQKIFMLIGPKRSGKSLIGRILTKLVGETNACSPTLSSLSREFGKQPLVGKTLALVADARISGRVDTAAIAETLLAISGEDPQTVERKFLPAWSGKLATRFVIITNELPRIGDMSGALSSRFIVLLLTRSFFGKEDLDLYHKIEAELPGILNWALEGRDRLYSRRYFVQPKSSEDLMQEFSDLSSPSAAFFREAITGPEKDSWIETGDLFKLWREWCMDNGIEHAGTAQNFGKSVRASIPYVTMKQRGGRGEQRKVWYGIKLTEAWAQRLNENGPPTREDEPLLEM